MAATIDHHGVDVCVDEAVLQQAPHCPHGPTLLFERFVPGKRTVQRYYACSACRDRKDCGFFQLYSDREIISETKKLMRQEYNKSRQPWQRQSDFYQRFEETQKLPERERKFCNDCQLLILPHDGSRHKHHQIKTGISNIELARPSFLLDAIENNKTNAQYLFSSKAVRFLAQSIRSQGFSRVLCIGVPRLHELIVCEKSIGLESLLLDIDHRYGQFYSPAQFCRYNMFNHFFLDGAESQAVCKEFLARDGGEGIVMVTDPPFGGLVDALASGVRWIMDLWRTNVPVTGRDFPVMWIFPYFLEQRIVENLPGFKMMDYKVDYDNHPLYKTGPEAKAKGSPVRIFTNLNTAKFVLPSAEGYRFCKMCERYVSSENQHCQKCGVCPSKNGTTYRHCDACQRCVKPSFSHCIKCNKCELPDHACDRPMTGCHMCGDLDHKRRDCPKRSQSMKRTRDDGGESDSSFMRTWPKRKKKKPLDSCAAKNFRPAVDENAFGTPQLRIPSDFKFNNGRSKQISPEDKVFQGNSVTSTVASSEESSPFSYNTSSSVTSLTTDFMDSRDENGNKTSSSVDFGHFTGKINFDSSIRDSSANEGARSKSESDPEVKCLPHLARFGQSEQGRSSFSSTDSDGRFPPQQQSKTKRMSKKSKLMEKIMKMRMRRKIKLKI